MGSETERSLPSFRKESPDFLVRGNKHTGLDSKPRGARQSLAAWDTDSWLSWFCGCPPQCPDLTRQASKPTGMGKAEALPGGRWEACHKRGSCTLARIARLPCPREPAGGLGFYSVEAQRPVYKDREPQTPFLVVLLGWLCLQPSRPTIQELSPGRVRRGWLCSSHPASCRVSPASTDGPWPWV